MIDQVYGRELPPMESWSQALLNEAIKCKVQFGVLVLGQGMVTGQLVRATPKAKMAVVHITHDPRDRLVGVDFPAEMRYISEIRHPAPQFSLMRPPAAAARRVAAHRAAAKELLSQTVTAPAASPASPATAPAATQTATPARAVPMPRPPSPPSPPRPPRPQRILRISG